MGNVDALINVLEPEIDAKCAQIKQKKSEKLLTRIFAAAAAAMLVIPAMLIFWGMSVIAVLVPIIFIGVVFLTSMPFLISKGDRYYEQI